MKCQKLSIKSYNSRRLLWAFKFCSKKLDELYCVGEKYFLCARCMHDSDGEMVIVIVVVVVWCVVVAQTETIH